MRRAHLLVGAALALTSVWVMAQDAPESLLPPGFDRPAPRPTRDAAPAAAPTATSAGSPSVSRPVVQAIPGTAANAPAAPVALPANLPPLNKLEAMTPEQLDELLGLKPKYDIPPAARRSMEQVGLLDITEGGLPAGSLSAQNQVLVRALLAGNSGQLVSRWGHILLRRALASRLNAPAGMNPADFAGLRAALLVRMGEGAVARALVQDVDTNNFTPELTQAALDAYVATADITGACPMIQLQGGARKDPQWQVWRSLCGAFSGDETASLAQLERQRYYGVLPKIDMLLAQKYAGAAGKGKQAVTIEWDGVSDMNPLRYALAIATGVEPPAALMREAGPRYDYTAALAPMLGLPVRAAAADRAAQAGVLSGEAMVDLYSQIYAQDDVTGEWADRASKLRDAYVAQDPAGRLAAMKALWDEGSDPWRRYSRQVLTAYAAARMPASEDLANDAAGLIASMLAAGLDANALRWAKVVDKGSEAWALLALTDANGAIAVDGSALNDFHKADTSDGARKSAFLLAGLAGLGKISGNTGKDLAGNLGIDLARQTRWTGLIDGAAQVGNADLVCLLAGLGMQGDSWAKMTPRYLFHIVAALNRVGLSAEARMIAAEAVARA